MRRIHRAPLNCTYCAIVLVPSHDSNFPVKDINPQFSVCIFTSVAYLCLQGLELL